MAIRNYRQAKRSREDNRKKRQQQKLERKLSRGATPPAAADAPVAIADSEPKDLT